MDISVLGPLEATAGGRPVPIGGGKPRGLLALLAVNAGSPVPIERLVDGLWGEEPPATAVKMVQLYVSQLRKALADAGDGAEIVTRGGGYELRLGDGELDARRFERLLGEGEARAALALWRGAPLGDVAGEPFAAEEIRRLEELRLAAAELAVERDLAAGRHREVIGELDALVAQEPLRERLHALLMLALYRSGRQAAALEAYRRARRALVEEIGIEPGPELRRLHEAILRQDPELAPDAVEERALPPELTASTPLAGREDELEWLREHWRSARAGAGRLVLVTGGPGMGKTRLAAELAREVHRDGAAVLFASLAGRPETACAALDAAGAARRPTLLVLDDADRAGDELLAALGALADAIGALPVLLLAAARVAAPVVTARAEATLVLVALDADAAAEVVRLYGEAVAPLAELAAASGGVPQRLHRAAAESARAAAAQRLGAAAGRTVQERGELRTAEDDLAGSVIELQATRERAERLERRPGAVVCPFKGLASFDVDDADFFFGREQLVAEMVARLAGSPVMGIVGPSGSGKSSALRAGLVPALREGVLPGSEAWGLALLRPGEHPLQALGQATADAAAEGRLVVAVDQFEEVFTACRDETERAEFVEALVACARDPRRRALILIAVRADFYGQCAAFPELSRLLGANHVLVGPMRRDELRRAIGLPARRAGLEVERDLADALIGDVEGEPGALPLLSTALLELWQRRDDRRLRLAAYEHAGGVHGAVARLAEGAYARLDAAQQRVARAVLLRLAGEGEGDAVVRVRVPLTEFGPEAQPVLSVLADDRLVIVDETAAEVAHEALLREWPRLRGWLDDDAQGRRLHLHLRAAAHEWAAAGRDQGELYRGARLASALDWAGEHESELGATERAFLAAGQAASGRAARRLRAVLASVAALLVLAIVAGLIAVDQRGNARDEANAAEAQRLGAQALAEDDIDRRLLLARQGLELDDSLQTRGNLLASLLRSPAAVGVLPGDGDRLLSLELSPEGGTLAVGDNDGTVLFLDTRTRRPAGPPYRAGGAVFSMALDARGERLALAVGRREGAYLEVLDARTHRQLWSERADGVDLGLPVFTPDGRAVLIAVVREAGPAPVQTIERFDARNGRVLARSGPSPVGHGPPGVTGLMPGGRQVVVVGPRETLVLGAQRLERRRTYPVGGFVSGLSPDGRTAAIASEDGSVRFLDMATGTRRIASGRHAARPQAVAFTPDGRFAVTSGDEGTIIVWDVRKAAEGERLEGHAGRIPDIAVSRDGRTLYSASLDRKIIEWDLVGDRRLGRPFRAGSGNDVVPWSAVSPDGRTLAAPQTDGTVTLTDLRTFQRRAIPAVRDNLAAGVAYTPDGRRLAVSGPEGFLTLFDVRTGRAAMRLRGHRGGVFTPSISADGRLLVSGAEDGTVRLWDLRSGRQLGRPITFRRFPPTDVGITPDGARISVGVDDGTVAVYDVRSRRRLARLRVDDVSAAWARFSPDGRILATGGADGRVRLWSARDLEPLGPAFLAHAGPIEHISFSADRRTIATSSTDGTARLWDIDSRQPIGAPLPGQPNVATRAHFTPDGAQLIAYYQSGRAYRWDVRPSAWARQACEVAGRRLTRAEWADALPDRDYDPAC